ncbi:MAG: PDZ domain-containing protein [Rhodospirillaceae bacterium]|jgi:carboxyl-terminal processing protease|nr:PDZ domain-containing protein [Rhodospirillaceae bacterium]MBT4463663.1 PDZ domain-containing protein [Rhodospirillaceae bacterium]MBT5013950.1 PDZ domain-containing protein [Rhodospirillaceae bacterium]MBT5308864.1 PDZ domain-containing protein [Rhodospirillaceae bacterium]MBT7355921.1 PDZ domain-containing protein [Rhodospirillaceae bacterium]
MTQKRHIRLGFLTGFIALFLTACAGSRPATVSVDDPFSSFAATEVLRTGFENISDRYIETTSPSVFVFDGLNGLGAIDPALTVEHGDDTIVMKVAGDVIADFPLPKDTDMKAWVDLTVRAAGISRMHSVDLSMASPEKIYEAIFDGILSNLDIYSRYAGAEEAVKNRAKREGFGGIGIRFRASDDAAVVTFVVPETPARRAGLKKADRITHINGQVVAGMNKAEIGDKLRGAIHSRLKLVVARKGSADPLSFTMTRAHIIPNTVTYGQENGVVFLKISSFNQSTARNVLLKLKRANTRLGDKVKGIVLDLRGNPGGLLRQSIKVADLFLARGRISETHGRHADSMQQYDAGGRDMAFGRPLVILLDSKTASAAEVAAAALQDRGRAVVIGTSSFGKGTVQTVLRLPNEGEITLTWSRLIAPSGYVLHELGVYPAICTSGLEADDTRARQVIDNFLAKRVRTAAVMEAWRKTSYQDKKQRQDLRAFCPPERRRLATDAKIAQWLIEDRALYARALNLSTSAAASAR